MFQFESTIDIGLAKAVRGDFDVTKAVAKKLRCEENAADILLQELSSYFPEEEKEELETMFRESSLEDYIHPDVGNISVNQKYTQAALCEIGNISFLFADIPCEFDMERFVKDVEQGMDRSIS